MIVQMDKQYSQPSLLIFTKGAKYSDLGNISQKHRRPKLIVASLVAVVRFRLTMFLGNAAMDCTVCC